MLASRLHRLPWALTTAVFAMLATADVVPSNTSTSASFMGTIVLQDQNGQNNLTTALVPITRSAATQSIEGNLFLVNDTSVNNVTEKVIAFMSCNPGDYPGLLSASSVFETAWKTNPAGIILYSTVTDYCNYTDMKESLQDFPVYSMSSKSESQKMLDQVDDLPVSSMFVVRVSRSGGEGDGTPANGPNGPGGQNNPLGPSPSTAVAMIILYSITGIITALFLVIIVTGAVRAHRHPDRYGPRDVLGRPRQSRARGLGRAILDTIPIVKFGEREQTKPTDVELGSTSEARGVDGSNAAANAEAGTQEGRTSGDAQRAPATEAARDVTTDHPEGIAPAEPLATGAAAASTSSPDEGLGCSICTDDFEKGQDIRVLPCNHKFHPECVDPWLLNVSGTCPLCRVDLRPVTSHDSSASTDPNGTNPDLLAPPLQPETDVSHRRRSALRDILSLRSRPNASPEERISALRRLREQRRNASGDIDGGVGSSAEDVRDVRDRRSKRMSVRLSGVFGGRRRRDEREDGVEEGESSQQPQPPRRDESPRASGAAGPAAEGAAGEQSRRSD